MASMGGAALTTVAGKAVGPVGYGMLGKEPVVCFLHSRVQRPKASVLASL